MDQAQHMCRCGFDASSCGVTSKGILYQTVRKCTRCTDKVNILHQIVLAASGFVCVCVCLWTVVQSKRINRLWCVSTSTKHPRIQQRAAPKPDDMKQISLDNKVSRSVDWPVTVVFSVSEINYQRFSSSLGPERSSPSHRNDSNYRMRFLYFLVQWVSVPADPTTTNTNTTTHTHTHILSNFLLSVPACTTSLQKGLLFKCTRNQLHFSVKKSVRRENGAMRRHVLLYSRTRRSSRPLNGKRVSLAGEKQCC